MTTTRSSRVDKLLENDGGGVNLLLLFTNILSIVQRDGKVTIDSAIKDIELSHNNQLGMMRHTFRRWPGDGVTNYVHAALELLEKQGRLVAGDGDWRAGKKFLYDKPMQILKNSNGHWVTVRLSSKVKDAQFELKRSQAQQDIATLVHLLEPASMGLRPVTPEGIESIKQSVVEYGLMQGHPIIRDQYNRILDGRHRLAVAQALHLKWPEIRITVENDREAVGIAMVSNRGRPWTQGDYARLKKLGLDATTTDNTKILIELALKEEHRRSDNKISQLIGCSHHTVTSVRKYLEEHDGLEHYESPHKQSRGQNTDTNLRPEVTPEIVAPLIDQGLSEHQINRTLGRTDKGTSAAVRAAIKEVQFRRNQGWDALLTQAQRLLDDPKVCAELSDDSSLSMLEKISAVVDGLRQLELAMKERLSTRCT